MSTQGLQTTMALTLLSSQIIVTRDLIKSLLAWKFTLFLYLATEQQTASTGETEDTHYTVSPMHMIRASRCQAWDVQSNCLKPINTHPPPHACEINPKATQVFPSYCFWKNSAQMHSQLWSSSDCVLPSRPFHSALSVTMRRSPAGGIACFSRVVRLQHPA